MKIIYCIFFFLFVTTRIYADIDDFSLILKFKDLEDIPKVTRIDNKLHLNFNDQNVTEFFKSFVIVEFRMQYPAAKHFDDPRAEVLQKKYILSFSEHYLNVWNKMPDKIQTYFSNIRERYVPRPEQSLAGCCFGANDPNEYVDNPGQNSHLDLINASNAWCITRGSSDITVGIADVNFRTAHPDLEQKFINGNNIGCGDSDYCTSGHGTKVAGLVAADTNNGIGGSAIGYNTSLAQYGMGMNALLQACADGASVVNCSWRYCANEIDLPEFQNIVDLVTSHGTIVVAASANGNYGNACFTDGSNKYSSDNYLCQSSNNGKGSDKKNCNGYAYPASLNNVISVGGIVNGKQGPEVFSQWDARSGNFNTDEPLTFSTFNDKVDLVCEAYKTVSTLCYEPTSGNCGEGWGHTGAGTSFAAPVVAGICGLIKSVNPNFNQTDAELFLASTAWDTPALQKSVFAGNYGAGIPDAAAALEQAVLATIPDYKCDSDNLSQEKDFECAGLLYVTAENDGVVSDCSGIRLSAQMTYDAQHCSYQWFPAIGLSDSNSPNPIASPSVSTNYRVTVTKIDNAGRHCQWEDWIWVQSSSDCSPITNVSILRSGTEQSANCGIYNCSSIGSTTCCDHWRIEIISNPFKHQLKINYQPPIHFTTKVTAGQAIKCLRIINSSTGKLLHQEVVSREGTYTFDASNWSQGKYLVYMISEQGAVLGMAKALRM